MATKSEITATDIEGIMVRVLARVASSIRRGDRGYFSNERFLHHMFTTELDRLYRQRGIDMWDDRILIPECPSAEAFRRVRVDLRDPAATRRDALRAGRRGNLDFAIATGSGAGVEWKGPTLCSERDFAEALLKLLMRSEASLKVLAVVLTSSSTGERNHLPAVKRRLASALEFVMTVLEIDSIAERNLQAFVASVPDAGVVKLHWGPVLAPNSFCAWPAKG